VGSSEAHCNRFPKNKDSDKGSSLTPMLLDSQDGGQVRRTINAVLRDLRRIKL
jgi:hypothetical protein